MNFRRRRAVDKLGKFMVPAASHAKNMQPLSLVAQRGENSKSHVGKCSQ